MAIQDSGLDHAVPAALLANVRQFRWPQLRVNRRRHLDDNYLRRNVHLPRRLR